MDSQLNLIYNKINKLSNECRSKDLFIKKLSILLEKHQKNGFKIDYIIIMYTFIKLNIHYVVSNHYFMTTLEHISNKLILEIMDMNGDPELDIKNNPRYLRDMAIQIIYETRDLLTLHLQSLK